VRSKVLSRRGRKGAGIANEVMGGLPRCTDDDEGAEVLVRGLGSATHVCEHCRTQSRNVGGFSSGRKGR